MEKKKGLNRRRFLWRSGVAVGGAALLHGCAPGEVEEPSDVAISETPAPARPSEDAYGGFKVGFQSYSLRHFKEFDAFVEQASRLNLPYVELYRGHLAIDSSPEQVQKARQALEAVGIQANAFGVENFSANHEQNEALFQFGQALGVTNLSANPSKDAFDSLEKLVQQYDIRIAIHNHGPEDERWRMPEWILEAVDGRDERIGACVDTGHYIRAGVKPPDAIRLLGSRVLGVHLKDFDQSGEET
ncbi:MAG TPA: TIM barrel protein, partial [Acidobacteriota bacterium]|nr:TIM barrel protein [Acidobacteriota bacterium]